MIFLCVVRVAGRFSALEFHKKGPPSSTHSWAAPAIQTVIADHVPGARGNRSEGLEIEPFAHQPHQISDLLIRLFPQHDTKLDQQRTASAGAVR